MTFSIVGRSLLLVRKCFPGCRGNLTIAEQWCLWEMLVGGGEGVDVGQETSSGDLGLDLKDRGYERLLWNWNKGELPSHGKEEHGWKGGRGFQVNSMNKHDRIYYLKSNMQTCKKENVHQQSLVSFGC